MRVTLSRETILVGEPLVLTVEMDSVPSAPSEPWLYEGVTTKIGIDEAEGRACPIPGKIFDVPVPEPEPLDLGGVRRLVFEREVLVGSLVAEPYATRTYALEARTPGEDGATYRAAPPLEPGAYTLWIRHTFLQEAMRSRAGADHFEARASFEVEDRSDDEDSSDDQAAAARFAIRPYDTGASMRRGIEALRALATDAPSTRFGAWSGLFAARMLVRQQQWDAAAEVLAGLSAEDGVLPRFELLFLRARTAVGRGDDDAARELLRAGLPKDGAYVLLGSVDTGREAERRRLMTLAHELGVRGLSP